jgi:TetR/AcrR family transcriptional regulator, regulator of cefoperazone and chloramphenicol sensitivity
MTRALSYNRNGYHRVGRDDFCTINKLLFCMTYKNDYATCMSTPERAVRAGSQRTRREILLAASRLFVKRGYADVSMCEVATAAGVFPNQITYYFGGKDALFIEAAGRLILEVGQSAEVAARNAKSVGEYIRILAKEVLGPGLPGIIAFVEAMLIARRRSDLVPQIKHTLDRLHEEGTRALLEVLVKKRWRLKASAATIAQSFWATMIGVALQVVASGETSTPDELAALALIKLGFRDRQNSQKRSSRRKMKNAT